MNWVDAKAFLERVVPWPVNGHGYINLHYSMTNARGGKDIVTGKPYQEVDQLLGFCNWAEQTNNIKELWYCTSQQSTCGTNSKGAPKATRLKANATALKAIWIDIDVKDDPKHYRNIGEAWAAATKFRDDNKLPQFSAAVKSGGGLHIYWISKTPLDPATWSSYAEGLKALLIKDEIKCDAGLTTDSARILRIPGTLNHKYTPPAPVELLPLPATDYDFEASLALLKAVAPINPTPVMVDFKLTGKPIIAFDPNDTLSDGLREEVLLTPMPIFSKCGFLQDAFLNGGKDYDNPLWNLTLLCATFMENGNGLAHEMSKGHAKYTFAETQEQYERKVGERKSRGLGYPSCATIKGSNCSACATCDLFKLKKSPLNIRPPKKEITATVTGGAGQLLAPPADLFLPAGYTIGHDGTIWKVIEREPNAKGEPMPDVLVKMFYSKLSRPQAQSNPPAIRFQTTTDKGNVAQAMISQEDFGSPALRKILGNQQVKYFPDSNRHLEGFLMAWMNKLHDAQAATEARPFGWMGPAGAHTGFCYGQISFGSDGSESPSGTTDEQMTKNYQPIGELKPWFDAHQMLLALESPAHEAIMAMGFAAPLMTFGGEYSSLLSAWSSESGSQKSSAMKVATSVWGHPKKTKEPPSTTAVSLLLKLGVIRNLPLMWDEITDETAQKRVIKAMFSSTEGVEGGRGTTKITQQKRGDWQLAMGTCSNLSLVDCIVREMPTTPAGVYRTLEFHVDKRLPGEPGVINDTDASRILQQLEGNYGSMGLKYAKFLAMNYARINQECSDLIKQVGIDLDSNPSERFWKVLVGCLIQGATYGNELGASFNVASLKDFLYEVYRKNRERLAQEGLEGGSVSNTDNLLTAYLKDRVDQMVWTDTFPDGMGRKRGVNVLRPPVQHGDLRKAVQIRWDVQDKMLRVSKLDMRNWLAASRVSISAMVRGLIATYRMKQDKKVLCAGTIYKMGQENVLNIPVPAGSALEEMLNMWSPPALPAPVSHGLVAP